MRAMSFNDILPIILVIVFWAVLFVFAFAMTVAALRVPTEAEVEAQRADGEHAHTTPAH